MTVLLRVVGLRLVDRRMRCICCHTRERMAAGEKQAIPALCDITAPQRPGSFESAGKVLRTRESCGRTRP